jgi:hypothetical protein
MTTAMTIRRADLADLAALDRLAALDSSTAPTGDVLVGEVGGELWAALEIATGRAIADPFRRSGEVVELLRLHAREVSAPRRSLRQLLPRPA